MNNIFLRQLYKEPMIILKMPVGSEDNQAEAAGPVRPADSHRPTEISHLGRKINGRLTIAETGMVEQQQAAFARAEEGDNQRASKSPCIETREVSEKKERLSDEKIIAEILKPAERLQISKSSDNKLLKLTGTNTAISLD